MKISIKNFNDIFNDEFECEISRKNFNEEF